MKLTSFTKACYRHTEAFYLKPQPCRLNYSLQEVGPISIVCTLPSLFKCRYGSRGGMWISACCVLREIIIT